ncbi:FAD/NAD(P)-binding domain-containing protein [Aspergillus campestris IBT 28561]|uniref:FAD/NAD(P)-binding domain-containing protein n=1 Tax=Aspergillus campestris (strain IBT 28561) TaxID=1392248 RepID=A0A2I1CU34_ASPC2|nr:FAD/NAD(P)-binding domain-containing protein [Aspergillus campestris IBT 28561]PKY01124.1 FAD/NAD(P)-binding domain-containing protein [Aspergillus campestris IBT 28561]
MTRHQIRRVAVIGAGISGVVTAAHLLSAGLEVTVFERNQAAGGVWLYDKRKPHDPHYPAVKPSKGEQTVHGTDEAAVLLEHAPPGACYEGLKNNVPTPLLRLTFNAWPPGTPDFVSHQVIKEYIQDTAETGGSEEVTIYGAKVTRVCKVGPVWRVSWVTRRGAARDAGSEREKTSYFEAVIVASGHYHAPRVPDIPGLATTKATHPSRITHSKEYRTPRDYKNKTVLLIGGGVSSVDIARELGSVAKTVYQSTRNGKFDPPSSILPRNASRVSEVVGLDSSSNDDVSPLIAHLQAGQTLRDIDAIIFCTGYHMTVPFLPEYHNDNISADEADEKVLVTDGNQVHNLHKDIFYIQDPTLAFVGIPYYTATFTLFEFQAMAVAAVYSGIASLPTTRTMRTEYLAKLKRLGAGKQFHSLKDVEDVYVRELVEWVNNGRSAFRLPLIQGHTRHWFQAQKAYKEHVKILQGKS